MSAADPVTVVCRPDGRGWSCTVRVGSGGQTTEHEVSVSTGELRRLAAGETEPTTLVELSFRFLLEREPKESILRRFELSVIERYFPEYAAVIGQRDASPPRGR